MDPATLFMMAVDSITAHKLRSFLVTLGILIGITAVLVNAAMVQGFRTYFEQQIQQLGSNFVNIRPGSSYGLLGTPLEEEDLIEPYLFNSVRHLPYVQDATASRSAYATINYMGEEANVFIVGAEPGYLEAMNREVLAGELLTIQDSFNAVLANSVLGSLPHRTFSLMSHFEMTIVVNGQEISEKFRIKGIVKEPEPGLGIGIIYIPIRTLNYMTGNEGYTQVTLIATDSQYIDTVKKEAEQMFDRLLKIRPEQQLVAQEENAEIFGLVPPPFESEKREYRITTQADVLSISNNITSMIQLALVAIAGISLLVGGIGIANVMLVTVAERTREIGVMKAVGAKNRHVLIAFLFEACVIGVLGGLIGMGVAAAVSFTVVPLLFDVGGSLPAEWAAIAVGICLAISLLSGLYPALRASRMDPVEALRSE